MAGGRKNGGMHVIAARGGASGRAALCTFDAGNLKAVAEAPTTYDSLHC